MILLREGGADDDMEFKVHELSRQTSSRVGKREERHGEQEKREERRARVTS